MKKSLFSVFAALMFAGANLPAYAADDASSPAHRQMYGYFNTNGTWGGSYGFASFNLDKLDSPELIYPYGDQISIYAGAAVDDVFYAYEYEYDSYQGPVNGDFISYDLTTGRHTKLGKQGFGAQSSSFKPQDMTYDYSTGTMYAIGFDQGESALYEVSLADGALTKVTTLQKTLGTIAADMDGTLYGAAHDGFIYRVNKADGSLQGVIQTGFSSLAYNQSMEFDHTTGLLYWGAGSADYDRGAQTHMLCINIEDKSFKVLGNIGINAQLQALYIPFAEGGDNAPAAPAGFTVLPGEKGAMSATLTWQAPTTSFGGESLADAVIGYVIERNGEKIAELDANATSYEDKGMTENGEYIYTIYARNSAGNGGKSRAMAYVGSDKPGAVGNMKFTVGDACASATLSWDAPTEGFSGGYFSPDGVTYKVVRQPDNKVVAEGLTETTVTDKEFVRLGRYTYTIYACNSSGETPAEMPEAYVLGTALDVPVTQDFSNLTYFENQWMAYDANSDAYSWTYTSEWGPLQFGDTAPCAEYIVNPGIDNYGNDADEWLITPPIAFDASKSYKIRLKIRCTAEETIQLTLGTNNVYTTHEKFDEAKFQPVVDEAADKWLYSDYEFNIPAGTGGTRCVGLHLTSLYPADGISYLQIGGVTIEEGTASGITAVVPAAEDETDGKVYTIDGCLVRTDGSLDGLARGIYIKDGKKYVVR